MLVNMSWFTFVLKEKLFSKKIYARTMSPYSIIPKLGSNAYLLNLHSDMDISPIFNVENLLP